MSKKRKKITRKTLDALFDKFDELPEKVPDLLTARELVHESLSKIEGMFDKGYSAADVVGVLGSAGVKINVGTLRRYLREAREDGRPARASKVKADVKSDIKPEIKSEIKPETEIVANIEQEQRPRSSGKFLEMSDDL
jgi:hypothetical protein